MLSISTGHSACMCIRLYLHKLVGIRPRRLKFFSIPSMSHWASMSHWTDVWELHVSSVVPSRSIAFFLKLFIPAEAMSKFIAFLNAHSPFNQWYLPLIDQVLFSLSLVDLQSVLLNRIGRKNPRNLACHWGWVMAQLPGWKGREVALYLLLSK